MDKYYDLESPNADVCTDDQAFDGAVDMREQVLRGEMPHALGIEQLCCWVIWKINQERRNKQ